MSKRAKAKQLSKDRLKCNKPKKTPSHKTKSHVVKACKDGKENNKELKVLVRTQNQQKIKLEKNLTMQDTMLKIQILISSLLDIGHIKLSGN